MIAFSLVNPPPMSNEERLRCLRLQQQGLLTWPPDDVETHMMVAYVAGEIFKTEQAIARAKKRRN